VGRTRRARLFRYRLRRDAGWSFTCLRGRCRDDRPCHGPVRSLPVQDDADAEGLRGFPRHAGAARRSAGLTRNDGALMPDRDTLDPEDWQSVRRTFHDAIDLAFDYLRDIREKPVWSATPEAVKARLI